MADAPVPQHGSRQVNAYACLIITFSAATITLVLRLVARRITKVSLWIDDYLATLAYLSAGSWFGLQLWWLQSGLGLFLSEIDLPVETALGRTKFLLWITELIYAISLGSSKLSILAFYWRMFKTTQLKRPIQILAGCALVWITFRLFMTTFHCIPVEKFWRSEIPGRCDIDSSKFFFGTVLVHFFIDIAVLALPIIEVRKLRLPIRQKIGVMSMFCFGFFVCAASIVVMVLSNHLDQTSIEVPWNISPIVIWATAEVNLAVVSACLPMLRPIYLVILRRPLSSAKSSGAQSYGHSKQQSRGVGSSHKLATLTTTKDVDKADTESTHQLATAGESMTSSTEDLERALHGNVTVVGTAGLSRENDGMQSRAQDHMPASIERNGSKRSPPGERRWNTMGGIMVTNEMSVRSDRIR